MFSIYVFFTDVFNSSFSAVVVHFSGLQVLSRNDLMYRKQCQDFSVS